MAYRRNVRTLAEDIENELGEIRQERDQEVDPDRWTQYADDPVGFMTEELQTDKQKFLRVARMERLGLHSERTEEERMEHVRSYHPNEDEYLDYGFGPWEEQKIISNTVVENRKTIVRSCNSAGKDWLAAHLALWWVYCRQGTVLFTGPTERQVVEVCMGEVASAWQKADDLPGELYRTALRMGQGSDAGILAFTSTSASKLTGFHAPRVFAIITEAQDVDDYAYEGMISCATGAEDRILAVGNPIAPTGPFYQRSMREGWEDIQISAEKHPNVKTGENIIPGGVTKDWVEDREEWKDNNPRKYRSRVKGEFPDSGEGSIIRRSWIDQSWDLWQGDDDHPGAMELFETKDEEWAEDVGDNAHPAAQIAAEALLSSTVLAIDPSRYGNDRSVVAVRYGPLILEYRTWQQKSTMEAVGLLKEIFDEYGVRDVPQYLEDEGGDAPFDQMERVVVDCIGPGQGIYDRLEEQQYNVGSFKAGRKPSRGNREDYADVRAEAYWGLRKRLSEEEIALPPRKEIANELAAISWKPTSSSRIRVNKKKKVRKDFGRSPDFADATMMAFYANNVPLAYRDIMI